MPVVGVSQETIAPLSAAATARTGRAHLRLQRNADEIVLQDDRGVLAHRSVTATSEVVIEGSAGDDTLTVDFTNGNPVPPGGITFNGGDQVTARGDVLEIVGGNFKKVVYDYTNAHDGSVTLDGSVIRYTGLEPLSNSGTAADAVFNFPAGNVFAELEDDGTTGNNTVQLRDTNNNFEFTSFTVPTNSLTINLGSMNVIEVAPGVETDFNVGLTINGTSTEGVHLNAPLNLNSGSGALAVTGGAQVTFNLSSTLTTSAGQSYSGPAVLGADTTLTSSGNGNITFGSTLDFPHSLSVNTGGTTTFSGAVGGTSALASITTDAAGTTAISGGFVTTTGAQTYNDALTLGGDALLTSTASGNLTFASTIDGTHALAANTAGTTTFGGAVGGTSALIDIVTYAAGTTAISGGSVTTYVEQVYQGAVTLGADTTLTSLTSGPKGINLLGTVDGAFSLVVNSPAELTFHGQVGATTPLTSITVNAGATIWADITTSGSQTYNGNTFLSGGIPHALTSSSGGNITFGSVVRSVNASGSSLTVNTAGTTTFDGAVIVGSGSDLRDLTTDAPGSTVINGGSVQTAGNQTFNDPVTLGADTSFTSTGSGAITFANTVNGAFGLTANTAGVTSFAGIVGGTTALTSLTTDAAGTTTIGGGGVTTTGAQSYNDPVTLGANDNLTSTGAGNIFFGATLDGAFGLTANTAGATSFGGAVGATTALTSLTTDAAGTTTIGGGGVTTTGAQTFHDPTSMTANTTFGSSGAITFPGTLAGPTFAVTKAGTGTMTLTTTNSFTGGTNVDAGTVLVNATAGSGTGNVTVASGATLGGTGSIPGSVTVQDNGIIAPGASIGTLTVGGGVTWNGSSTGAVTANFELSNTDTTSDQLAITGAFTKGSGPTFKFDFQGSGHPATYTLATFTAGTTFSSGDFTYTNLAPGLDAQFALGINSLQLVVVSSAATHFTVTAPATATAGSSFSFTVKALDGLNNVDTTYGGTVQFTSSDAQATLPANSTLTAGIGTFSATLKTAGNQTITATDTVTGSITGTSNAIAVSAGAATRFTVTAPASTTAGSAFNFTVTALDGSNNVATGYSGTVHFTSTDGAATLPANTTLTSGTGTFPATLRTAGAQTISATDTVNATISGTSNSIMVNASTADHFSVTAPPAVTQGAPFNFTVNALDAFNNVATTYAGSVHFTSSDSAAALPANSTLTNGAGTFPATLNTGGNQMIVATDTVTPPITGTSASIVVSFATLDLSITNTPSAAPYGTGQPITYTIVVNNRGAVDATAVTVTDVLPAGATFTSATPTQGTCSGTTTVTCSIGTLVSGASATISLTIDLPSTPGTVSDTATVSSSNPDSNPANDSATATVNVIAAADIPMLSPWMLLLLALAAGFIAVMRLRS
ncbi:MAG TPA: autotransporter-associated beta strand repeat-containing protein [Thermoanaerobaculia bacterium]|nr:autotransporter-associated beta strand repeat-containing protein [Thermoanaerobaculia bacterium]